MAELQADYYEVLQVSTNADPDTIHRLFRILAQRFHPDNQATGDSEQFRQVSEAYEVLKDDQKRAAEVREAKDRVRAALHEASFEFPSRRITVNLAPADLPKDAGAFDLPIALGLLVATGQLLPEQLRDFATAGEIRVADLEAARLILFDRTTSYFELTSPFFRDAGFVPKGLMEIDNVEAAKKMVEHGLGPALLPRSAVTDELESGRLVEVPIADAPSVRRTITAIRRRRPVAPSALAEAFLATVTTGVFAA